MTLRIPVYGGAKLAGPDILLEGKIVLLNIYSSAGNPYRDEVVKTAVSWRNSYLPQMAVPNPEPVPSTITGATPESELSP